MISLKQKDCIEERKYYIAIKETYIDEKEAVEVVDKYLRDEHCVELTPEGREKLLRPFMLMKLGTPYQINLKLVSLTEKEFWEAARWFSSKGIIIKQGI